MTHPDADRIERTLERLADALGGVREQLAGLAARVDTKLATVDAHSTELTAIRAELSAHKVETASIDAELRAENRRLWWGVGLVLSAVVGQVVAAIGGAL